MHRVPEVIDCWFDSGSMPFAQHHYPFENEDLFKQQFPADFISEAVDQTRGWFYSLLAISTLLFNKAPYKNVIVLGHVQDENGQKMSKSKGNAVDPFDALETYGADAIRWYFYSNSAPWLPNRFHGKAVVEGQRKFMGTLWNTFDALETYGADAIRWYFYSNSAPWLPNRFHGKAVVEGQRKFMGTLWNTYAFFVLYANIDGFDATKYTLEYDKLGVMDKWLLSKLNTLTKTVDEHLANYRIPESARALQDFVDDMSNWYVRRSRERFWAKGMEQDKINAYMTLYTALVTVSKVAAPMIPFMTEEIYQNLVKSVDASAPESIHLCDYPEVQNELIVTVSKVAAPMIPFMTEEIYQNLVKSVDASAPESIHLCDYPEVQNELIDEKLEADMDNVLKLVVMGRACRNASNIKNRQPIGQMFVKAGFDLPEFYQEIVADELNVKNVKFTDRACRNASNIKNRQPIGQMFVKAGFDLPEFYQEIVADELNVKNVKFTDDVRDFTSYSFKPQLKTVGPKYGKMLGGIKAALDQLDGNAAMDEINETGSLKLDINGQEVTLFKEDLLIDTAQIEGYVSENDNGITVVLDTNLTEELLEEGFVREIISKIQTMRKEAGFEVMDKIKVTYKGSEKAEVVFAANGTLICSEVLAVSAEKAEPAGFVKEWKINGEAVFMGVEKEGR